MKVTGLRSMATENLRKEGPEVVKLEALYSRGRMQDCGSGDHWRPVGDKILLGSSLS